MTPDQDPAAPVLVDRPAQHVVRLRLNRPDKRNAIDQAMREALLEAAQEITCDESARAIVFGGADGVFSAGGDLPSMANLTKQQAQARLDHIHNVCRAFAGSSAPIVSAMEGVAAGASVGLALLGDHIVVGPSTRILFPFIKLGLTPDWGLMRSLPQRIGLSRARTIFLTGASVDGAKAFEIGLADELVPDDAVMSAALERAAAFAALPRLAVARVKAKLRAFGSLDLETDLEIEAADQVACLTHPEFAEGLAAQLERRPPDFLSMPKSVRVE
ncbi:MAG: enoyl-CoA hydratase/isomerase family protein [Hyphomonadaceae bacterium]